MTTLDPPVAFKEWAAVCRALAVGIQTVILRKGGIAEEAGAFRPDHLRFWLYPTYFHEPQIGGVRPEFAHLLEEAEARRTPNGTLRLTHIAEVSSVRFVDSIDAAQGLASKHILTAETVQKRFHYRDQGLYVFEVRVSPAGPLDLPDLASYAGCKSWVPLVA